MIKKFGNVVCVVFLVIASAGVSRAAEVERPKPNAISVIGNIDSDTVANVKNKYDDAVKIIGIASGDSDYKSDMELGLFIREHHLLLFISKYCLAGCAQWIFPAAEKRLIDQNAIVSFLGSASAFEVGVSEDADKDVRDFFHEISAKEKDYYEAIGAPEILLYDSLYSTNPSCYRVIRKDDGSISDIRFDSQTFGWTPTSEYMNSINVHFEGFWPKDGKDFDQAVHADGKFKNNAPFMFGGMPKPRTMDQVRSLLSSLKRCTAS